MPPDNGSGFGWQPRQLVPARHDWTTSIRDSGWLLVNLVGYRRLGVYTRRLIRPLAGDVVPP
jgi:hypothetical protein